MVKLDIKVKIEEGLHSRYAVKLVDTARNSESNIKMIHKGNIINPKSIISILSSSIIKNDDIIFEIDGKDESYVAELIKDIFK